MEKSRNNVMTDYILSMEERIKREPVMAVINSAEFLVKKIILLSISLCKTLRRM